MDRRTLLKQLATLPLFSYLSRAESKPSFRRVRPGDPAWPSAASWDKLKQQVGGNLIPVEFPLAECQATTGPACQDLFKNLSNPFFIGDSPAPHPDHGMGKRMGHQAECLCSRRT